MNQWIASGLCVLMIVSMLSACGLQGSSSTEEAQRETGSMTVGRRPDNLPPEEDEMETATEESRQAAPEDEPGDAPGSRQITVYLYRIEENNYFPTTEPIGGDNSATAILDVVTHLLGLPAAYETGVEEQDGQVVLDFLGEYIDTCLQDEEVETIFLNTLCATIVQHRWDIDRAELRRDGGAYRSAHRILQTGEPYAFPAIIVGGGTAAEYTEMRLQVPYDGMRSQAVDFLRYDIVPTDSTAGKLTEYLARVGDPGKVVDNVGDLGAEYVLSRALENVIWYTTENYGQPEVYHPELLPIATAVQDNTIAMAEHVEQTARELFGNVPFVHSELQPWGWHPIEGVYTPPHTSTSSVQPVILSYDDRGDSYYIELVYLQYVGVFVDDEGTTIPAAELESAVQNRLRRREVVVEKSDSNQSGLLFQSHQYL